MFEFAPTRTDDAALAQYSELFRVCFPGADHLREGYLRWLYRENPSGPVIGYDAFVGERLAGHYVCVPADMFLFGQRRRAMLSLNTATHPEFQGRGLFTELARRTYALGAEKGFSFVYGVANANSTPGFTRKLGFQLVSPLEAKISMGRLAKVDWPAACQQASIRGDWTGTRLAWRAASPRNQIRIARVEEGVFAAHARTGYPGIVVCGEVPVSQQPTSSKLEAVPPLPRLFLGLLPAGTFRRGLSISVPDALRPSPLNLIYRSLDDEHASVPTEEISLNFLDFDAY